MQKNIKKHNKVELAVLKHNIEAILFAAGKALEIKFIADLCHITEFQTKKQLDSLKKDYSEHSVLMIVNQDDTWKMTVRESYLDVVRKIVSDTELSKSTLETLSMIAYRNPALQSEVVKARGVVTYDHVAELVRLGFVIKERIGRSFILKLSEKFYEYFELNGKKIKEVFQPVKERADEQLELGNLKIVNADSKKQGKDGIFEKTKEQRLGDLEVIRIENQQNGEKINELRENHKDFLSSIDQEIESISERTDVEEKDIEDLKSSDVQDKINSIKSDELGEEHIITGDSENLDDKDKLQKDSLNAKEMLEETEKEIKELTEDSKQED